MIARIFNWYLGTYKGLAREVWILSLVMLINRSGTMVIPFLTVYLTRHMGYSLTEASYVMAAFGGGSVVGAYIGGKLTDRLGFYPVQFWSLFLSGIGFFFLMFLESLPAFCAAIFLISCIADAFRPAGLTAIGAYSRKENRTRSFALVRLAINLGWAVGPAAGGFMAANLGYDLLFITDGLTCIGAAILYRMLLKSRPPKEKEPESNPIDSVALPVYRNYRYLLFLLSVTLGATVFMQLLSTLPVCFRDHFNMSEDLIGLALALNGGLIVVAEMPIVHTLESRFPTLLLIAGGTFLMGISLVSLNLFSWPLAVILCILLLTFGEIFNMPFTNTYALSKSPQTGQGQYLAFLTISYSLAHIGAPVIGLQVADRWGYEKLWYLMGAISIFSMGIALFLNWKEKQWT